MAFKNDLSGEPVMVISYCFVVAEVRERLLICK
jgi:hypothetical protein